MRDCSADSDRIDDDILTCDVSDEALEAAAGMDAHVAVSMDRGGGVSLVAFPFCC